MIVIEKGTWRSTVSFVLRWDAEYFSLELNLKSRVNLGINFIVDSYLRMMSLHIGLWTKPLSKHYNPFKHILMGVTQYEYWNAIEIRNAQIHSWYQDSLSWKRLKDVV